MEPAVLLVATTRDWQGSARMPWDLATAGWSVSLLAPKGSHAARSRYVRQVGELPDNATPLAWVYAFAGMVKATTPRLVMPCDDTAFRLMQQLVLAPPNNLQPALQLQLAALIADSLGDPAHYRASVDKTRLCQAAEAAGMLVPAYKVVGNPVEARSFAAMHGWPIVLKRSHSSAGDGVAICADEDALKREFPRLLNGASLNLSDSEPGRLLVQAYVPGRTQYFAGTTWRGRLLCGYAVDRLEGEPCGPASVVRYFHCGELEDAATKLALAFGTTGIFAPEYIVHERTGARYLIEINRRITPGTHRGAYMNMSSGAALLAASEGSPSTLRVRLDDGEERVYVSFPLEWLRDPQSDYLRNYPVDVPWDEPELIEAILAMRHDR